MSELVKCAICFKKFKKSPSFVSHLKIKHKISKNDYIKKFNKKEDFEYNIRRSEETKRKISQTKKKKSKNGEYDFSYLKKTNIMRSKKYVEKLNKMTVLEKKEFLKKWQEAGSEATKEKWKNICKSEKEKIINKILKNRERRQIKTFNCWECNKEITTLVNSKNTRKFCNHLCQARYQVKNNKFINKGKYKVEFHNKTFNLRSLYEVEFLEILKDFKIKNIDYEKIQLKYYNNVEKKESRYVVDFLIEFDGNTFLIEIGNTQLKKINDNAKNITKLKFKRVNRYCKDNKINFLFLNEKNLKLGNKKIEKNKKINILKDILNGCKNREN